MSVRNCGTMGSAVGSPSSPMEMRRAPAGIRMSDPVVKRTPGMPTSIAAALVAAVRFLTGSVLGPDETLAHAAAFVRRRGASGRAIQPERSSFGAWTISVSRT